MFFPIDIIHSKRRAARPALGLLIVLFSRSLCFAQDPSPSPSPAAAAQPKGGDEADLQSLLKILKEETAVATKSRMNGDYVPGIVTVLHGDEVAALGARTVWDALSMVPGIEAVRDTTGLPSVTVRGIQFPFNSGNVKVLIDSMPAARDNAGVNSIVFDMPIQMVDRIEVIRGPGSVVYGDFAYMGLIHIITRKTGASVYGRFDEGGVGSGGLFTGGKTKGGLEYSLSGSGASGGSVDVPGRRDVDDTRAFAAGSLKYRAFSLSSSIATREVKDRSGAAVSIDGQQTHSVAELRYEHQTSKDMHVEARLSDRWNRYRNAQADLDGDVVEGGVALQWTGAKRQSWLVDASFTRSHIDSAVFRAPQPPAAPPAPPGAPPAPPAPLPPLGFSIADKTLGFLSLMAQDTIDVSSKVALTAGARLDRFSDIDTRVTPRASMVFRLSEQSILKFQYAQGFRAPNFFELYSRGLRYTNLDFEVNQTSEVNFVHRTPGLVLRVTGYNSRMNNLVYIYGADAARHAIFENRARARVNGVEVEGERELTQKVKAVANLTWLDVRDTRAPDGLLGKRDYVPKLMGNVALIAAPIPKLTITGRWHFVTGRTADALPDYHEFEATATLKGALAKGLDLRSGVRFSKGDGVVYAAVLPNQTAALDYKFPKVFVELAWSR